MKLNSEASIRPVIEPMLSLINVVFLLLIFFLVVGHITAEQQIEVQMLTTENRQLELNESNEDWLYISSSGSCYYHEQRLDTGQLDTVFPVEKTLYVAVDGALPMGKLQPIMTALKQLAIADISLITRLEE